MSDHVTSLLFTSNKKLIVPRVRSSITVQETDMAPNVLAFKWIQNWLIIPVGSVWQPCDELVTGSGCTPPLAWRQLGQAPASSWPCSDNSVRRWVKYNYLAHIFCWKHTLTPSECKSHPYIYFFKCCKNKYTINTYITMFEAAKGLKVDDILWLMCLRLQDEPGRHDRVSIFAVL